MLDGNLKNIATWIREVDEGHFARVFSRYPRVRVYNARTGGVPPDRIDALMLTGGSDISQPFLRQPVPDMSLIEDADPARDGWEFDILPKVLRERLPFLGICRGFQVLNVAMDGTLHLDIPGHESAESKYGNIQELRYVPGAALQFSHVNSSHHQAVARLGHGLEIEAWAAKDDIVEQMRLVDYPFGFAVQYHPERDAIYDPLFDAFVRSIV